MTVYGPYKNRKGRQHVIHYTDGLRKTQSYPRFLMEQHLGRTLEPWEQVDHINGDRIENFQLLTAKQNSVKHVIESGKSTKYLTFTCPICTVEFQVTERQYKHNQIAQRKAGPYCSKRCAGKAHH